MIDYAFMTAPTPADVHRIVHLYRRAGWWETATDSHALVNGIVSGSHCFLVARKEGTIVAMGRAISDGVSDAYIQDVTVDPVLRGQGIGSQMVSRLVERLEKDGIGWIGLIAEKNTHPFYRPLGFAPMTDSLPMRKRS